MPLQVIKAFNPPPHYIANVSSQAGTHEIQLLYPYDVRYMNSVRGRDLI